MKYLFTWLFVGLMFHSVSACSILYYVDEETGKIYVVNNEDYWYDTPAYIQVFPATKTKLARLWYGWDNFAQGGINEAGLFFDGAVTPNQDIPEGHSGPDGNLGDDILAKCSTITDAVAYLEREKIALKNAHMMFGDSTGNAVVVEWINGARHLTYMNKHYLLATNFLLADTSAGDYPCYRYNSIEQRIADLENSGEAITLNLIGNTFGGAIQPPQQVEGKLGGTLYSTFINITDMELVLVYKMDSQQLVKIDLADTFATGKKTKIKLEGLGG